MIFRLLFVFFVFVLSSSPMLAGDISPSTVSPGEQISLSYSPAPNTDVVVVFFDPSGGGTVLDELEITADGLHGQINSAAGPLVAQGVIGQGRVVRLPTEIHHGEGYVYVSKGTIFVGSKVDTTHGNLSLEEGTEDTELGQLDPSGDIDFNFPELPPDFSVGEPLSLVFTLPVDSGETLEAQGSEGQGGDNENQDPPTGEGEPAILLVVRMTVEILPTSPVSTIQGVPSHLEQHVTDLFNANFGAFGLQASNKANGISVSHSDWQINNGFSLVQVVATGQ